MPLRLAASFLLLLTASWSFAAQPSIALYYGANLPWDELHAFDVVVVEPQNVPDPKAHATSRTALFAYVAVGEVSADRGYMKDIPAAWKLGQNSEWGSVVIDQARPEWPAFFVERVIKPLWNAGYRGFFLDTLDSYQLFATSDADKARQEAGLVAVIHELKKRYPDARLIFNRGFEILPQVHQDVFAVAAESLFQGWSQSSHEYRAVPASDRDWLLGQLKQVQKEYGLPVLSIDYVEPGKRNLARDTAAKIRTQGFIPWVTNPELDMLGVGDIEVMPRKVLMIHNSSNNEYDLMNTSGHLYGAMPLNYLGYAVEYLDARRPLPSYQLAGRYAGIVVWLDKPVAREGIALVAWLKKQIAAGVPITLMGECDFFLGDEDNKLLGLQISAATPDRTRLHIVQRDPMIGYETEPIIDRQSFFPLHVTDGKSLLTLANAKGETQDAIAITSWGGYVLNPHLLVDLPGVPGKAGKGEAGSGDAGNNIRWVVNPIEFLRRSLRLPDMPVPDVTTESGRRLLMVHMDGDGFASRAEFPGSPYAAEVLYKQVLQKYQLPSTISIIQGEVASNGLYPAFSADLEKIAREIFALPHVEMASHSFSHPFSWSKTESDPDEGDTRLNIPNYKFDLKKEIPGTVAYIESRLAPPGKKLKTFLWTGDCNPGADAIELAYRSGLVSMNGGDTTITHTYPSLTLVAPLGIPKKGTFQVYAPNQNENVYTNDWLGPFYGYERVIETFQMTESPLRLKPIDIYYHTYSASKPASLRALDKVYQWALTQETTPVYVSDYAHKVLDFNSMVVARTRDGWLIRGTDFLRELRAPLAFGQPSMSESSAVAGFIRHGDTQYLHLAAGEALIRFRKSATPAPYLVSANARIENMTRTESADGTRLSLKLHGNVPLRFTLALGARCTVEADGIRIKADRNGSNFSMPGHDINELRIHCPR